MELKHVLIVSGLTLVLSLLLPIIFKPLLLKLNVVDVPSARSSHDRVVIRGMGISVLTAVLVGTSLAVIYLFEVSDFQQTLILIAVGVFAVLAGVLGFGEDLKGVSVSVRSFALLIIASGAAATLTYFGYQTGSQIRTSGDSVEIYSQPDSLILAEMPVMLLVLLGIYGTLFISGYINVANFMDGLNGISGLHGLIAGISFAVLGWIFALEWLTFSGVILAVAFAGFIPWNLKKQGVFLGDVGSYLLGGSVAVISFAALTSGIPVLATIGPMVIYFGDVAVTLIKRIRSGYRWDEPHKEHVYQRLQQQGRTHVQASSIVALFTAVTSALGIASVFFEGVIWALFLLAGLLVLIVYLNLVKIKK